MMGFVEEKEDLIQSFEREKEELKQSLEKEKKEKKDLKLSVEKEKEDLKQSLEREREELKQSLEKEKEDIKQSLETERENLKQPTEPENEPSPSWEQEKQSLLQEISELKAQTAQLQPTTLLPEDDGSLDDQTLSVTPSLAGDDASSIITFTTMSVNPYAQEAIQKQNETLMITVQQLRAHEAVHQKTITQLKSTLDALTVELHKRDLTIGNLTEASTKQNETIESLRDTIKENNDCLAQQTQANEAYQVVMSNMQEKLKKKEAEVEAVKTEQEAERQTQEVAVRTLQQRVSSLEEEKKEREAALGQAQAQLVEKEAALQALRSQERDDDMASVFSYHSAEGEEDRRVETPRNEEVVSFGPLNGQDAIELKLDVEENKEGITVLRDTLLEYQNAILTYQNSILQERDKNGALFTQLNDKTNEVVALESKLSLLQIEAEKEKKEKKDALTQLEATTKEKEEKERALSKEEEEKGELQETIRTLTEKVSVLEASVRANVTTADETKVALTASQQQLQSKTEEFDLKKTELERQRVVCESLNKKCSELEKQVEAKNQSYHGLVEKYNALAIQAKTMVQETKQRLTEAYQKQVDSVSGELKKKDEQLSDLKRKYHDAMAVVESFHSSRGARVEEAGDAQATESYKNDILRLKKELDEKTKALEGACCACV